MRHLIFLFVFAMLYKAINNYSLYRKNKRCKKEYGNFLDNPDTSVFSYEPTTIQVFKSAGIQDIHFTVSESLGFDLISTAVVSHFTNLSKKDTQVIKRTQECFSHASHIFMQRVKEAFSPLYWLQVVINLPKVIFIYLGLSTETVFLKVTQLLYWLITPLLIIFRSDIYQYLIKLLGSLE